jgi:ParB/RepB/Spo0J family partition protein
MRTGKVRKIPLDHLDPNPHNPRRLFDEEPMKILKESIRKLGVLVPVTVYPKEKNKDDLAKDQFVLLDGERRWRCATSLQMRTIPAIIVEQPTEIDNILTMFHIHNLREGWQLMPTALKLEVLMKQLKERSERKLYVLTRLSITQIRRCKILLSYPKKFQNMMLAPPTKRLKSDFFIELHRIRHPLLKKVTPWKKRGDVKCIDIILDKYLRGIITAVTEFRKLAEVYRGSIRVGKIREFYRVFDKFLDDRNMGIDSVIVEGASFEKETKEATKSVNRLSTQILSLDIDALASNKELILALKKLLKLIQDKLAKAMVIGRDRDITK